jgi:two-component system, chemotaxis family, sensor kinase Cph1
VDSLLAFSQMRRTELARSVVDMNGLVTQVQRDVQEAESGERRIEWEIGALPEVQADPGRLRLVVRNLLSNAVKYTRPRELARIAIGCEETAEEFIFHVQDNGVGFDRTYVIKLFGVFQRLHRVEEFEGTGIGLATSAALPGATVLG